MPTASRRHFLSGLTATAALPSSLFGAWTPGMPARGLCAHRGAMQTHPENTLPAFEEAVRLGAHMIEFDIQLTQDGTLVLMHDATVDRTTEGKGKVNDLTFAELRALDAGSKKDPCFKGTRIPTFEETLAMMPHNVWLNCHLKGGPDLAAACAKVIQQTGRQHQAFLACSKAGAAVVREEDPGILICNMDRQSNALAYVQDTLAMKAAFIQLSGKGEVAEEHIRLLKASGVHINYFQSNTEDGVRQLFQHGVDFPLVNDLGRFLPIAKSIGIEPWKHSA